MSVASLRSPTRFAVALACALTTLVGCTPATQSAHHTEAARNDEPLADPAVIAAASRVRVIPGKLECVSELLGLVDVHERVASQDAALELLKRRAAALGAEAVTGVEFEHGEGGEPTHLSGSAVRCKDLLRGRRFEVLGKIEVTAEMDHEADALAELKSRALARGANLILEVRFDHGEGKKTRVLGTAVRAYETAKP